MALISDGSFGVDIEAAIRKLPRQNRTHRFVDQRARGRIPDAAFRRINPKLQQDVIGLQGGIGGQIGAPIALGILQGQETVGRPARGLRRRYGQKFLVRKRLMCSSCGYRRQTRSRPSQLRWQGEAHVFIDQLHFFQPVKALVPQESD